MLALVGESVGIRKSSPATANKSGFRVVWLFHSIVLGFCV